MMAADEIAVELQMTVIGPANHKIRVRERELRSFHENSAIFRFVETCQRNFHELRLPFRNDV
jgi:hypothetical protein